MRKGFERYSSDVRRAESHRQSRVTVRYVIHSCALIYLLNHSHVYIFLFLQYTAECNKLISQFRLAEKAALGKTMTTE